MSEKFDLIMSYVVLIAIVYAYNIVISNQLNLVNLVR